MKEEIFLRHQDSLLLATTKFRSALTQVGLLDLQERIAGITPKTLIAFIVSSLDSHLVQPPKASGSLKSRVHTKLVPWQKRRQNNR